VHVTFVVGVDIVSFCFEQAWARACFWHSKHFMPACYALEEVDNTRPAKISGQPAPVTVFSMPSQAILASLFRVTVRGAGDNP
jgi:hypothetical protein